MIAADGSFGPAAHDGRMPTMVEHIAKYVCEPPMLDTFECSCGWKSRVYYDGAEYAQAEWNRHVAREREQRAMDA